jgi:hypothetical protein
LTLSFESKAPSVAIAVEDNDVSVESVGYWKNRKEREMSLETGNCTPIQDFKRALVARLS